MKVVGKRILVKQALTKKISEGGIHMTGDQEALPYGKVVAVSLEQQIRDQNKVGFSMINIGDTVLFSAIGAIPLGHIKKDHVLIEQDDILAILEEEDLR